MIKAGSRWGVPSVRHYGPRPMWTGRVDEFVVGFSSRTEG